MKLNTKIRKSLFETNSSSTHSITIQESGDYTSIKHNGKIELFGGEFGWEWVAYRDALIKANYCAVYAAGNESKTEMLKEVISEHTGAEVEILVQRDDYDKEGYSYIDHQSSDTADDAFASRETLKDFIFGVNSTLYTGNDNGSAPANFYDAPGTKYVGELKLQCGGSVKLTKLELSDDEIDNLLYPLYEDAEAFLNIGRTYPNEFRLAWRSEAGEEKINFKNQTVLFTVSKSKYSEDKERKYIGQDILEKKYLKYEIIKY
jgi:hypothetical protein